MIMVVTVKRARGRTCYVVTDRDTFHFLQIEGLSITPLPVFHGGDYICMGFEFSPASPPGASTPHDRFVYLSDVSKIPEEIMRWITRGGGGEPPQGARRRRAQADPALLPLWPR